MVNLQDFYNHKAGTQPMHIFGVLGSGKTLIANQVALTDMKINKSNMFIPGDRFCEFRHFYNYSNIIKKIVLIFPKGEELHYSNIPFEIKDQRDFVFMGIRTQILMIDYFHEDFDIMDLMFENTRSTIFVIYDNHLYGEELWKRTKLWVHINLMTLNRIILLRVPFIFLFNEAGILLPQIAFDKQYREVKKFAELIVEARKGFNLFIMISQIESQIEHTIRIQAFWKIIKKAVVSKRHHELILKYAGHQSVDSFILENASLFALINKIEKKFKELKTEWRIIPQNTKAQLRNKERTSGFDVESRDNSIRFMYKTGKVTQDELSLAFELHRTRIGQIVNKK